MVIGAPREVHRHEHRVGLTPFGVGRLAQAGHTVLIEKDAGSEAWFADRHYQAAGARIVYDPDEVYGRSDVVCRVGALDADDIARLKPGSVVCGFHHLAVAPREVIARLAELEATLVGYEVIRDARGDLPVLTPMSEMAGRMAVNVAAHLLQNEEHGRGILLGNVPGVPPPTVLILGAGTVGRAAASQAIACGAHVIVMDADVAKLRVLHRHVASGQVVTVAAAMDRLERYATIADVVIGAVLIPGERAPFLVTREIVRKMKPGSVILDVSIDQGGCVETSRPTTLDDPTFVVDDVVHYCVPNMTANVARTASRALAAAALPYVLELARGTPEEAIAADPGLARGIYLYRGRPVNPAVAQALGRPAEDLPALIGGGARR
jgi:alanine dehydrogenase